MSKRSNRPLSSLDTNSELDEILSSAATRPSLGFLGLDDPAPDKSPVRSNGIITSERRAGSAPTSIAVASSAVDPQAAPAPIKISSNGHHPEPGQRKEPAETSLYSAPSRIFHSTTPIRDFEETSPDDSDLPDEPLPMPAKGGKRLYRCYRAQDGHSHLEQEIYAILWKHGQPEQGTDSRICSIGYSTISYQGRVHRRNIGVILNRLAKKLAIEIVSPYETRTQVTKTYRVFSYSEILRRRKAAGLEWIIRGRGVEFVDPETREPLFSDKPATPDAVTAGDAVTASHSLSITSGGSAAVTASGPTADTAPPPRAVTAGQIGILTRNLEERRQINKTTTSKTTTSFSGFDGIVKAMNQVAYADDHAAEQLLLECQAIVPDVTAEEICIFIAEKSVLVRRTPTIQNPIGFLLVTVPKCFVGEAFQQFRKAQRVRLEQQDNEAREAQEKFAWNVARALELLTDDDTPAEQKAQIEAQFRADPYRRLRDHLSEEENQKAADLWSLLYAQLGRMINRSVSDIWLRPLKGFKYHNGILKVVAPSSEFSHVEEKYSAEIEKAVARVREESDPYSDLKGLRLFAGFDYLF